MIAWAVTTASDEYQHGKKYCVTFIGDRVLNTVIEIGIPIQSTFDLDHFPSVFP